MRSLLLTIQSIRPQILFAYTVLAAVILVLVTGAVLGGRAVISANMIPLGELHTGSRNVEGEGATTVEAEIILAFGQMTLSGGADDLLEVDWVSNVTGMQPAVTYDTDGQEGTLFVAPSIPSGIPDPSLLSEYRNEWDVRLQDSTALDLSVMLGMGQASFDMGGLALTNLEIEVGTGDARIDLRGDWKRSFDTFVDGGTGKTTLLLPGDIGVRVEVEQGIGAVNVVGLEKEGDVYVNSAYGSTDITLNIEAEAGMGELNLEVRDDEETD